MSTKPILFNTDMAPALLCGRKTVTRRVVKGADTRWNFDGMEIDPAMTKVSKSGEEYPVDMLGLWAVFESDGPIEYPMIRAPYQPGDILYVREAWLYYEQDHIIDGKKYAYKADETSESDRIRKEYGYKWHPSIHMPKEAARIFLRVTNVRVERLQSGFTEPICPILELQSEGIDIGETCQECIENYGEPCCVDTVDEDGTDEPECGVLDEVRDDFARLWDSTIKPAYLDKYGWAANPWVWVIEFERIGREVMKVCATEERPECWPPFGPG